MDENKIKNDFYMSIINYSFNGENPYSSPKACGLELVDCIDRSDGNYQFDFCCIWERDKSLFYGYDSGCSCPVPFEDFHCLADLTYLGNIKEFEKEIRSWYKYGAEEYDNTQSSSKDDIDNLIYKIKKKLKEWSK